MFTNRWFPQRFTSPLLVGLLVSWLSAPGAVAAPSLTATTHEADADFDYIGGATTHAGGDKVGSMEELNADFRYVMSPQVSKRFVLRLGGEWQRSSLGVPHNTPLPDTLQELSAIVGTDCQLTDHWLLHAEVQPGFYSDFDDLTWRDVDAPFVLSAAYIANADFQWFAGLRVDLYSHYPVWPALGMRWKYADDWTLNLVPPNPRLEYDLNERLKLYLGGRIMGGTFRVGDQFGDEHSQPRFNHALLDRYEVTVGPGLTWKIRPNMTFGFEAGYMVYREFNYFHQHFVIRSDPAPYARIAWHARF